MNNTIQYTIRNVPLAIDAKLKAQARQRGVSLNKLVLSKLGVLPKRASKPKIYHDLDWLMGSMPDEEADALDRVVREARQADKRRMQVEYEAERTRGEWT